MLTIHCDKVTKVIDISQINVTGRHYVTQT